MQHRCRRGRNHYNNTEAHHTDWISAFCNRLRRTGTGDTELRAYGYTVEVGTSPKCPQLPHTQSQGAEVWQECMDDRGPKCRTRMLSV
eukprot:399486-Rhodomonas_salina.2